MVRLKNLVDSRLYQKELVVSQKQQLEAALEQIKETESMLVQNEKLASLGRLSAGLIHEINNPLNYARQGLHIISRSAKAPARSEKRGGLRRDAQRHRGRGEPCRADHFRPARVHPQHEPAQPCVRFEEHGRYRPPLLLPRLEGRHQA
jgi:hypothetical protein